MRFSRTQEGDIGSPIRPSPGNNHPGRSTKTTLYTNSGLPAGTRGKKGSTSPRETADAFHNFPSFPKLRAFNPGLHHIDCINDEVIKLFANCPHLERADMGGATWGGDKSNVDYSPLLHGRKLNTFTPYHASLYRDPACTVLAQLPEMIRNTLDFVTDAGGKVLAKLPSLETLKLGDRLISPAGIEALSRCRGLAATGNQRSLVVCYSRCPPGDKAARAACVGPPISTDSIPRLPCRLPCPTPR